MRNPFLSTPTQEAGHGEVHLALLPPSTPVLQTLTYQYPLKLISPTPIPVTPGQTLAVAKKDSPDPTHRSEQHGHDDANGTPPPNLVHTLYILTYGGGIVAGDAISLSVTLAPSTRLILLTQGSTKIFRSPAAATTSKQDMRATLHPGSALCYLPDPVQPFRESSFVQKQVFDLLPPARKGAAAAHGDVQGRGSLCVLDWVSCGRAATGENWDFWKYGSKNEVYMLSEEGNGQEEDQGETGRQRRRRRLLLRDNLVLDAPLSDGEQQGQQRPTPGELARRMDGLGVFGTLVLYGALFERAGRFFTDEFKATPRIGARKWDSGSGDEDDMTEAELRRRARQKQETADGLLWTAAAVRGCTVVKFGAREVEGGRRWLRGMLETEGTVVDQFGERALMCLR